MKAGLLSLLPALLLWQAASPAPTPDQRYLRYDRTLTVPATGSSGQACAVLDGAVYAHAAPSLKDVRLYQGNQEIPYVVTLSQSAESDSEPARVQNLGLQGSRIVFDLEMPARPYTDVTLNLDAQDFIASATVTALSPGDPPELVRLGTYTLFDLSGQHLSRNTTLHLQESSFPRLHITLDLSAAPNAAAPLRTTPEIVKGATVPPSREAQTVYTPVATTGAITQRGRQSIATFRLPAHIPVERVAFTLQPAYTGNFSRNIQISAREQNTPATAAETLSGSIMRVRTSQAGRELRQQQLTVPATLGANLQNEAVVEVAIENGDDTPLPISGVQLEMRERQLCFNVPSSSALTLYYGDADLEAPVYDVARTLSLSSGVLAAKLSPEQPNPAFIPRPVPPRPLTERHPELLWIALLAVVCILAVVAINSSKRLPK